MAKTQNDIANYLDVIYDAVILNGKTHDEALAITSDLCNLLISPTINSTLKMVEESARGSDFIKEMISQDAFNQSKIENTQLDKNNYKNVNFEDNDNLPHCSNSMPCSLWNSFQVC